MCYENSERSSRPATALSHAADLIDKLDVLRAHCPKCPHSGRYNVAKLIETVGMDSVPPGWTAAGCRTLANRPPFWSEIAAGNRLLA
jgi:hypothetical protein